MERAERTDGDAEKEEDMDLDDDFFGEDKLEEALKTANLTGQGPTPAEKTPPTAQGPDKQGKPEKQDSEDEEDEQDDDDSSL